MIQMFEWLLGFWQLSYLMKIMNWYSVIKSLVTGVAMKTLDKY